MRTACRSDGVPSDSRRPRHRGVPYRASEGRGRGIMALWDAETIQAWTAGVEIEPWVGSRIGAARLT